MPFSDFYGRVGREDKTLRLRHSLMDTMVAEGGHDSEKSNTDSLDYRLDPDSYTPEIF